MSKRIVLLSFRGVLKSPAMCCVVEFENVFHRSFNAEILEFPSSFEGDLSDTVVICVTLSFDQFFSANKLLMRAREKGAKVLAYVFDAWNVRDYFYSKRRVLKARIFSELRLSSICDRLFVPFEKAKADFFPSEQATVTHLPLGVDTSLTDGRNQIRPISVLGYGKQPKKIDDAFGRHFNRANTSHMYYHTQHMHIGYIHDFAMHRKLFWKIAQNSNVAIAYGRKVTQDPSFYPIVGQRWFECLAAGCVIVGKKPVTPEADVLLGWENATIELPDEPEQAIAFIVDLLGYPDFVNDVRERNVEQVRANHDWRHRAKVMLAEV